jgi:hypothetical protein
MIATTTPSKPVFLFLNMLVKTLSQLDIPIKTIGTDEDNSNFITFLVRDADYHINIDYLEDDDSFKVTLTGVECFIMLRSVDLNDNFYHCFTELMLLSLPSSCTPSKDSFSEKGSNPHPFSANFNAHSPLNYNGAPWPPEQQRNFQQAGATLPWHTLPLVNPFTGMEQVISHPLKTRLEERLSNIHVKGQSLQTLPEFQPILEGLSQYGLGNPLPLASAFQNISILRSQLGDTIVKEFLSNSPTSYTQRNYGA